jgi:ADP-heptose:LPS heptosyltransferase
MSAPRVNLEYLNLYQEIPLFCALELRNLFRTKARQKTGRVLIVNSCLVGEFAASVPALRDFIVRHPESTVDLMVAPHLVSLAERIRGVRKVYAARSVYGRCAENIQQSAQVFDTYDTIFVMRISKDVYRLIRALHAGEVHTALAVYSTFGLHLWGNLLIRRTPRQWRELNFAMLGGVPRDISFDDVFEFTREECDAVAALEALQTSERKVIVHTGVGWVMKRWPLERWVALLKKVHELGNIRFIFVGGGDSESDFTSIASQLNFPVYSLIGQIDIAQLVLVLRTSDYFIGVDSGPKNLAHLADVRSVSIFGPGPHFYLPYDPRDVFIDKTRGGGVLQMFFAKKQGYIHQITVNEVYEAFKRIVRP